jgi:hypothetical protein
MQLESIVTCPHCGFSRAETMPTEYCQIRYTCSQCGTVLKPLAGDCCIYCSYGSAQCPSKQAEASDSHAESGTSAISL